jgi:hypothetical protein
MAPIWLFPAMWILRMRGKSNSWHWKILYHLMKNAPFLALLICEEVKSTLEFLGVVTLNTFALKMRSPTLVDDVYLLL